tara:strand:- start:740 stop:1537 length:798 start_codon:yes stop_codon:yes gene_type:complete
MSGWMGKAVKAVQGSNKAIIKKGSSVSTENIPDGLVVRVDPKSTKTTVKAKDGSRRETIKSKDVWVKPGPQTTNPDKVYADKNEPFKRISDFSENDLAAMSDGEIRQKLINSNFTSYSDLAKAAPGDSATMRRVRNIGQHKVPGLRKTAEESADKKGRYAREKELAAKELADQKQVNELVARKREFADKGKEAYNKKHTSRPDGSDPEFQGNFAKLREATQRYTDTGKWAKGGSVNVKKSKKYREVENKYSNRMLPNKRKTTRIY